MSNHVSIPAVNEELIKEITNIIVKEFKPKKVVLFGSRAWGKPRADSDIDLLVIMESKETPARRAARIRSAARPKFISMDIIVRTPSEIAYRLKIGDYFLKRILEKGKVLYDQAS